MSATAIETPETETPATVNVYGTDYAFTSEQLGTAISRWKAALAGAETTVENADALFGRTALVALLSGTVTQLDLAVSAFNAFKPRDAKGRAIKALPHPSVPNAPKSVSGLRGGTGNPCKGGNAARVALERLFTVHTIMNSGTDADGANVMEPLLKAFIDGDKRAPRSIQRLGELLAKAAQEHAKATGRINDNDETDETGNGETDETETATETETGNAPFAVNESNFLAVTDALAAFIESADADALEIGADNIGILLAVIRDRFTVNAGDMAQAA